MVPFLDLRIREPALQAAIQTALTRVIERGNFILGEELEAFEHEFAAYCGVGHGVGVGTGLDALELALRALGVAAGDEVIVPATTFIATWLAVSRLGAVPVAVEVASETGLLDPDRIEQAITPRTRAIVPVHLYGLPAPMTEILEIARRHDLRIVADAAQAHGAKLRGLPLGCYGDAVCYSFYPSKNLGAFGDGGAVVTASSSVADRIRSLRNYGSRQKYHHLEIGTNSRLDEIQAAVLRCKLPYLDRWNDRRREIETAYSRGFANLANMVWYPAPPEHTEPVWHLYPVRLDSRDGLAEWLRIAGMGTLVHYPVPPHMQPPYAARFDPDAFSVSRRIADTTLSLPIGPYLDEDAVAMVVDRIAAFPTLRQ